MEVVGSKDWGVKKDLTRSILPDGPGFRLVISQSFAAQPVDTQDFSVGLSMCSA